MASAGSSRAVVFASWDCGSLAMLLAATHPERTAGLVLCDTFAVFESSIDSGGTTTAPDWSRVNQALHDHWGRDFDDTAWGGPRPSETPARQNGSTGTHARRWLREG